MFDVCKADLLLATKSFNILFPIGFLFIFLRFKEQKFVILLKPSLSVLLFMVYSFFYHVRNLCLSEDHKNFLMFTSRSIIVLALKFRSMIHFQLIFVSEVKVKILF